MIEVWQVALDQTVRGSKGRGGRKATNVQASYDHLVGRKVEDLEETWRNVTLVALRGALGTPLPLPPVTTRARVRATQYQKRKIAGLGSYLASAYRTPLAIVDPATGSHGPKHSIAMHLAVRTGMRREKKGGKGEGRKGY